MEQYIRALSEHIGPLSYLVLMMAIYLILRFVFWLERSIMEGWFESAAMARKINLKKAFTWPLTLSVWSLCIILTEPQLNFLWSDKGWQEAGSHIFGAFFIFCVAFSIYRLIKVFSDVLRWKYNIESSDNLKQRMVITQLQFIEKMAIIVLCILTVGLILLRFESLAKFGGGVLASAGLASVIIGFAAQESVSNLIAGFQIAFTQPFRIDDAVVVEEEWGWIEEIALTYVVVRLWDKRRLVIPIKYFTTQVFQNWTRTTAQIIGTVELYLDYRAPIEKIRKAFENIVRESELWDKDVQVLQVTDASDTTLKIRGLVSAKNSPITWDLRCEVREKLLDYIQRECPEALPQVRVLPDEQILPILDKASGASQYQ